MAFRLRKNMLLLLTILFLIGIVLAIYFYISIRQTTEGFRYKFSAGNVARALVNTGVVVASGGAVAAPLTLTRTDPKSSKKEKKPPQKTDLKGSCNINKDCQSECCGSDPTVMGFPPLFVCVDKSGKDKKWVKANCVKSL